MPKEQLVVLTGPLKDRVFEISGAVSIGRSPDNVMHLDDLQVSRKHAIIERDGRGVILRDLGSGNGTFVAGRRVLEYKLAPGDIIKIGMQEIRFDQEKVKEEGSDSGVRFESGSTAKVEAAFDTCRAQRPVDGIERAAFDAPANARRVCTTCGQVVDDAADGIGAVDGGRTVLEDFDALHGGERDLVEVDHAAVESNNRVAVFCFASIAVMHGDLLVV